MPHRRGGFLGYLKQTGVAARAPTDGARPGRLLSRLQIGNNLAFFPADAQASEMSPA